MVKTNLLRPSAGGLIEHNHNQDGIDRRGFLKCMAWAGTGAVCMLQGGVLKSYALEAQMDSGMMPHEMGELSFVQISDSHMGFNKAANPDVVGTLKAAVDKINALPRQPEFILHTGDITHLSNPEEFDLVDQILKGANKEVFFVPGEHDVLNDDGAMFLERYAKQSKGRGWYSFDKDGVHFIGLVNVVNLKAGGLGTLGHEQINWLARDVKPLKSSTPIVVFAHIPLWTVYPQWGWGTDDSARALSHLKRFGSVTVLNGHIHQTMQKVEGNVTFHTALSTAFPQPAPGMADGPGPMKVPADRLRSVLGITEVSYVQGKQALAVVDSSLA
jgi:3',5'-cyclic-AMP phosphodiesterase